MLSGRKAVPLTEDEQKEQVENFEGYAEGMVKLEPGGWLLMKGYVPLMDSYYNFKFKPTDVVVMTFPKCGTTWTQEILWTIMNNPNLDHPKAHISANTRCPFLECDPMIQVPTMPHDKLMKELLPGFRQMCPGKNPDDGIFLQLAAAAPDPRIIKTHFPFSFFNPKMIETCKVVYVARNPKDVCVSFYHHSRILKVHSYVGTFEKFVDLFVEDKMMYSPYGKNLIEAWDLRHHKNLRFIFYEDMKANTREVVTELSEFVGADLTPAQIDNVLEQSSFASMKSRDNAMVGGGAFMHESIVDTEGGFFRKGVAGSYKEKMSPEQEKKIDEWAKRTFPQIPFNF